MKLSPILFSILRAFFVLFFVISFHQTSYGQTELKVMTYNIYHGENPLEPGSGNLEDIADLIKEIQPDFVALQEVDSLTGRSASLNNGVPQSLVEELAKMTGMHGYFGKAIDYDGGGYGEGMLSREPVQVRKVMLPIPSGGEDRAMLIVETTMSNGESLLFAGTHLCHQFSENRLAQVEKINEVFEEIDQPAILVGDLNFVPDSEPYQTLEKMWVDMAKSAGATDPTISYENPTRRIDYMFGLKKIFSKIEIVDIEVLNVGYSDHMPVVATIRIN